MGEHGGQDAVGDPQTVALDQPLDGEGDRDDQDGDARGQAREGGQEVGRVVGALGDVGVQAVGGRVRETGDGQDDRDAEQAEEEADQVGGAVHAGGEQRFVDGDGDAGGAARLGALGGDVVRGEVGAAGRRAGGVLVGVLVGVLG